jgi:hypothetical protein
MNTGNTQAVLEFSQNTVYLMGASFVLGSLFTLFLLLVLDFVRRNRAESHEQ